MTALLACMSTKLDEAGRGICNTGITAGAPVLGPNACGCSSDCENPGGQLTVTLQRMYPIDANTFSQVVALEDCRPGAVGADLAFTLARCHPTIDETGNYPDLDTLAPYADGVVQDAQIVWSTFQCPCETGMRVVIRSVSTDSDPLGGCSAVGVTITVLVTPGDEG